MRSISPAELNELLVDQSTLKRVQYDKEQGTATLEFILDDLESTTAIIQCKSVFQICLTTFHGGDDFSSLGINPRQPPVDIDEVLRAFVDQPIFEWTMDCDEVEASDTPRLDVYLMNEAPPSVPHRGIAVFKDTQGKHYHLSFIGTELLIDR